MRAKREKAEKQIAELEGERVRVEQEVNDLIAAENYGAVPKAEKKLADLVREVSYRRKRLAQIEEEQAVEEAQERQRREAALHAELDQMTKEEEASDLAGHLIYKLWDDLCTRAGRGAGSSLRDWSQDEEDALIKTLEEMVSKARALIKPVDLRGSSSLEGRIQAILREIKEVTSDAA